jgi:HK97 family phage prohead protease
MSLRETAEGGAILEGRMMPYNEWTEVNSSIEGHFLERFAPGSLAKTMLERARRIRVLFEHGLDRLGKQPIATSDAFDDREDGAYFEATLLRGLPELLVEGLRSGVYGSSIRFRPVKWDRARSPEESEHNPGGIPEHTIREAYMQEFSVVTFPQYEGATAAVRSLTDEISARQLMANPEKLLEIIQRMDSTDATSEPQHSHGEEGQEPDPSSRSTQPTRDYLQPQEGVPTWRL